MDDEKIEERDGAGWSKQVVRCQRLIAQRRQAQRLAQAEQHGRQRVDIVVSSNQHRCPCQSEYDAELHPSSLIRHCPVLLYWSNSPTPKLRCAAATADGQGFRHEDNMGSESPINQ